MAISRDAGVVRHGRGAERREAAARGWWDLLRRVRAEIKNDNLTLIAAGLALYALLAVFPALAAVVSLYGFLVPPDQIAAQFGELARVLPPQAATILRGAMESIVSRQGGQALGVGAVLAFLLALWSARKGMVALMQATNIAYGEPEERGPFMQVFVSLALTLGAVLAFILVLSLAVAAPLALRSLGLPPILLAAFGVVRWAVLWFLVVLGLGIVYRFAPDRAEPEWRWVSWGAAIAATVWVAASLVFSLYVQNFGSYGETYGALAGVVVLLLWFFLSGFVVILGAEINAELGRGMPEPTSESGQQADLRSAPPEPAARRIGGRGKDSG